MSKLPLNTEREQKVPDISDIFASTLLYNLVLRLLVFHIRFPPWFLWFFANGSLCRNTWEFSCNTEHWGRSQWPRSLRCGSAAARLPELRVRIPLEAWMCVCCKCCVLLETSALGWSLVYRSLTEYGVSDYNREDLTMRRSCL